MSIQKDIVFVRHGESEGNIGLPAGSSPNRIPLTTNGINMAKEFAANSLFTPELIVSSPYLRAQQTAQPYREKFPTVTYEEWPIQEFTYLNNNKCIGTTFEDRRSLVHSFWEKTKEDISYCDGNNAESYQDFIARIRNCLEDLVNRKEQKILLFGHELFLKGFIYYCLHRKTLPVLQYESWCRSFQITNTSATRFRIEMNEINDNTDTSVNKADVQVFVGSIATKFAIV